MYRAGGGFAANEESPDFFLMALASQAKNRIDLLSRATDDTVDPAAVQQALANLAHAKQLAAAFGLDSMPVDIKIAWIQQRQANPSAPMPLLVKNQGGKGSQFLDDARREINAGRLIQAKAIVEEAFDAKYGVQQQARDLLHSIELAQFDEKRLDSERGFFVAYDAFQRNDYKKASSILAGIDERLLSEQARARLREMAMNPAMRSQPVGEKLQLAGGAHY